MKRIELIESDVAGKNAVVLRLRDVRLSFPSLFEPSGYKDSKPKYQAAFMIEKGTEDAENLKKAYAFICKAVFGGKKIPMNMTCLEDGDSEDSRPEYKGCMVVSAKSLNRPQVVDIKGSPLMATDGKPYAGCYVNASIRIYGTTEYKRVCAELKAVQFFRDGEPFGAGGVDVESEFGDVIEGGDVSDDDLLGEF